MLNVKHMSHLIAYRVLRSFLIAEVQPRLVITKILFAKVSLAICLEPFPVCSHSSFVYSLPIKLQLLLLYSLYRIKFDTLYIEELANLPLSSYLLTQPAKMKNLFQKQMKKKKNECRNDQLQMQLIILVILETFTGLHQKEDPVQC